MDADTITALATPPGPAARAILRLSGPATRDLLTETLSPRPTLPTTRTAFTATFHDGCGPQPALVLWMPGPRSYTREDVAELHLPGNPHLVDRALARLVSLGAHPAAPGEFTRRAFLNGRIDLSRAEGVLELVEATGEAERRAASRLLAGGLARRVEGLRDALDDVRSLCEASLDFDETDTGHVPQAELLERVDAIARLLDEALAWEVHRQAPRALPRILLHGAPNAGKSSLFNALAGANALVSDHAGTTRDWLEALWELDGASALLLDAPGLDRAATGVDAEAQRLAEGEREAADLVLWVVDGATATSETLAPVRRGVPLGVPVVVAWNKVDLPGAHVLEEELGEPDSIVRVSALSGVGLAELRRAAAVALGLEDEGEAAGGGHARELFARHREALGSAAARVARARAGLGEELALDLVAEVLREATAALDEITGRTSPEDLLDRIFERFCLGK